MQATSFELFKFYPLHYLISGVVVFRIYHDAPIFIGIKSIFDNFLKLFNFFFLEVFQLQKVFLGKRLDGLDLTHQPFNVNMDIFVLIIHSFRKRTGTRPDAVEAQLGGRRFLSLSYHCDVSASAATSLGGTLLLPHVGNPWSSI